MSEAAITRRDGTGRSGALRSAPGGADEQGFIWIVDRKKDLIISGGENISSIEVEQAVATLPRVEVVTVAELPKTASGKIAKVAVRELIAERQPRPSRT
jgi:acyl-coenzyme A synthetase/AMP-(fatty) acid ligase